MTEPTVFRTYKYRLRPKPAQAELLDQILGLSCWLHNHALAYRRKRWQESRQSVSYNDLSAMWTAWRNEQPDENPMQLLNATSGRQVLRQLDSAYRAFLKGTHGFPRFQRRHDFNSVAYVYGNGAQLRGNRLYVQNVGLIRVRWHRELPDSGTIRQVRILRRPSGWYALFQIELPDPAPEPSINSPVGIDMGILHALTLSDGSVADSPRYLAASLKKLRVLQRRVARRKKGSAGRREAVHQLARHMEHIASQRRDWWHKVTRALVEQYGQIVIEDLSLTFMLRSDTLARAAHDTGLGIFTELLTYKAEAAGVRLVRVDPRGTSRRCSGCGEQVEKTLKDREHNCPACGLVIDRDLNAAINILQAGIAL